ncbi:MAG: hypothetical protein EON87_01780 [Brevundimonas sp.]|nr:MAG: hypothetical protein EON87_01780 [Brevundimonas sp.]
MGHWYPAQSRIDAIAGELRALEAFALKPAEDIASTVAGVSAALSDAARAPGFPQRQLGQWTWVGSQYRLHAGTGGPVAGASGAALAFLAKRVGKAMTADVVPDLNWVLETTIQTLWTLLPAAGAAGFLSDAELKAIEARLEELAEAPFDEHAVRQACAGPLAELTVFAQAPQLQALPAKVEGLFTAARRPGEGSRLARAALLYLAQTADVVRDTEGFLGLLDDAYVIDLAFAAAEQQTRCLPLLNGLLADYPYVADVALVGEPSAPLDLYAQYVVCAALDSLRDGAAPAMLVLRETGPFPLLAAFFAAVGSARAEAKLDRERLEEWPAGQHVVISDGTSKFRAVFVGAVRIGGARRFQLAMDKDSTLTVPEDLAPYIAAAKTPHKRLSSGRELGEWMKHRHVDPLSNLTGSPRRRDGDQMGILLVGSRSKLDAFIAGPRPLGSDIGAAVGLKYVVGGRFEPVGGTATDTPYIYACSDADTAYDMVRNPPPHIRGWRVVVDGARAMRALHASLTTDGEGDLPPMCALVELHDRETAWDLLRKRFSVWYLEDHDVRPPSLSADRSPGSEAFARVLGRQSAHWHTVQRRHVASHNFLEAVAEWMVRAADRRSEGALQNLDLLVSHFMRAAVARPVATEQADKALRDLARGVAMQAAALRHYSDLAAELCSLFAPVLEGALPSTDRRAAIAAAAGRSQPDGTAVVCRSLQIAAACAEATRTDETLGRMLWTNLDGVRTKAPFERIIVPGWLDRLSVRELANNGYASSLELVFYPFEQRWFDRTMAAGQKWERRIEAGTIEALTSVTDRLRESGREATLWRDQTEGRLAVTTRSGAAPVDEEQSPAADDEPEFERLEARSIAAVHGAVFKGREHQPVVRAQLVLFDEPGRHAFLRAGAKVIVMSGPPMVLSEKAAAGAAEKILYRSVESLEPGWLLALPAGGDRDLIDARADQFIGGADKVRAMAAAWKTAIRRYMERHRLEPATVARRMREAGVARDAATIRSWASGSATIAPRGYREVVPVIARLTGDPVLRENQAEVLQAIDLIYRARTRAADAIVAELFAGEIDLTASELRFELNGSVIRYGLHRVRSLDGLCDAPADVIGKVMSFIQGTVEPAGAGAGVPA